MLQDDSQNDEWIMLNVGGKIFTTTRTTLCTNEPNSMLARMFSQPEGGGMRPSPKNNQGAYLIDRSPKYFEPILNYLRHGKLIIDHDVNIQGVLEEAKFYGIASLLPQLELETERWFKMKHQELLRTSQSHHLGYINRNHNHHHHSSTSSSHHQHLSLTAANGASAGPGVGCPLQNSNDYDSQYLTSGGADGTQLQTMPPLTRQDVIRAIMSTTSNQRGLRFQGCNLASANLSKLDLRHINFKYANLRNVNLKGANLSGANFERADLFQSNLEGSQMIGTNMAYANLENSNLRAITVIPQDREQYINSSFQVSDEQYENEHRSHNQTYPHNDSRQASLYPRANFESANLRNANLEGSRLAEANLRMAILEGSNLQNCDLTRAILTGSNLENCDLSGSDLNEANLRKANTKGARYDPEVL